MARTHRSLTTTKFVNAVSPEFIRRYILTLDALSPPSAWAEIIGAVFERYLVAPENVSIAAIVREDFRRINDVCTDGMGLIVRAYRRAGLEIGLHPLPMP